MRHIKDIIIDIFMDTIKGAHSIDITHRIMCSPFPLYCCNVSHVIINGGGKGKTEKHN